MNQGQVRIACPQCRSNNFVGQPRCWQCGSSLPPPETVGQAPSSNGRQQSAPTPMPAQTAPGWEPQQPTIVCWVYCAETDEAAWDVAREYMGNYVNSAYRHYEIFDAEHFEKAGGYDFYAKMARQRAQVSDDVALNACAGVQVCGLAALIALACFGYSRVRAASQATDNRARLQNSENRIMQDLNRAMNEPSNQPTDGVESSARRELQRLDRQLGSKQPQSDANGEVHLLGGGTISRDQWEKARRSLSEP